MRKVKHEYERCAETYKNIMMKINEQKGAKVDGGTSTATATTAENSSSFEKKINSMRRSQQPSTHSVYISLESTTSATRPARNSSSSVSMNGAIDEGETQIKTVCW